MLNILLSWVEFFEESEEKEIITNIQENHTQISSKLNVYVTEAAFINLRSPQNVNGGAIAYYYSSTPPSNFLVEKSYFERCISTYHYGGAIYCEQRGACVINKCCSSHCHVEDSDDISYYAQFLYIKLNTLIEYYGYICDSSIIYSDPSNEEAQESIRFIGSNFTAKTSNISFNTCQFAPTISCQISIQDESISLYTYLILANNTANLNSILSFLGKGNNLENSNVINNIQTDLMGAIISCSVQTNLTIKRCCFLNNIGKYLVSLGRVANCIILDTTFETEETFKLASFASGTCNQASHSFINIIDTISIESCENDNNNIHKINDCTCNNNNYDISLSSICFVAIIDS